MPFIERRRTTRYDLQLPVLVRWRDGSEWREVRTVSKDVSSKGIYFVLAEEIKDGTSLEVVMALPNHVALSERVRVSCSGRVHRIQPAEGAKAGVAAVLEKYRFLSDRGDFPPGKFSCSDAM